MSHQSHVYLKYPRLLVGALIAALVALSIQVLAPRLAPQADASSGTLLCVGFDGCQSDGMSNNAYHQHWGTMYWRMYSGRNCVNYAAYRMVEAGMPNVRPWSGSGNAMNWGVAMSSITDSTPRVGAIAWWRANAPGAGSLGHVAYVEKVISPTEIVVSESNWGSDFDWREVSTSSGWPSGFIHFVDRTIKNTVAPTVNNGAPTVGKTLKVVGGAWSPRSKLSIGWYVGGKLQPGKTTAFYTPAATDLKKSVWVKVTASSSGYTATSKLLKLGATKPGTITQLAAPIIGGTNASQPIAGRPLTVGGARFKPSVSAEAIQWYADGTAIDGATHQTFTPGQAQVGKTITAVVTGSRTAYTSLKVTTLPTPAAIYPPVCLPHGGSVTGTTTRGGEITVDPGTFGVKDVSVAYQWLRNGVAIPGATKATYVPTSADVGHWLSVTVDASAPKRRDLVRTLAAHGQVTTKPHIAVSPESTPGVTRIRVTVQAPGVAKTWVSGSLTVHFLGQVRHVTVTDGTAVLTFSPATSGRRALTATYSGAGAVLDASATTHVSVKAPAKKTTKSATK